MTPSREYLLLHCTGTHSRESLRYFDLLDRDVWKGYDGIGTNVVIYRDGTQDVVRDYQYGDAYAEDHGPDKCIGILLVGGSDEPAGSRPNYTAEQVLTLKEALRFFRESMKWATPDGLPKVRATDTTLSAYARTL